MTRFGWLVMGGVFVAALGIALLLWGFARQAAPGLGTTDTDAGAVDPETLSFYASGEYGFSFPYPATASLDESFGEGNTIPWRLGAQAPGTPIVRVRTASGEVRIGASGDARAKATCGTPGPSEEAGGARTIGTTTWKTFSFDELGTDNERRVTSYRTLHNDLCFAIETFVPLMVATSTSPVENVDFIVQHFLFAR